MSGYAQCWVGKFYVGSSKNEVDPNIASLFRERDKRVVHDRSLLPVPQMKRWLEEDHLPEPEDDPLPHVYYCAPAHVIADRLSIFGYTVHTATKVF